MFLANYSHKFLENLFNDASGGIQTHISNLKLSGFTC